MDKRELIKNLLAEVGRTATTEKSDISFPMTLARQLAIVSLIKTEICPSDISQEFINTVLTYRAALETLEFQLTNEVEGDKKYNALLAELKEMENKITTLPNYIKATYTNPIDRREAIDYGKGQASWNRYRVDIILDIENKRFKGLMSLMKRNNLLLAAEEDIHA